MNASPTSRRVEERRARLPVILRTRRQPMAGAMQDRRQDEREADMRALAEKLQFTVDKTDGRFTLTRTADLSRPEREENLTLPQAEELLRTWKLRGLGGG
jgi:hypothetical protein